MALCQVALCLGCCPGGAVSVRVLLIPYVRRPCCAIFGLFANAELIFMCQVSLCQGGCPGDTPPCVREGIVVVLCQVDLCHVALCQDSVQVTHGPVSGCPVSGRVSW